MAPWFGGQGKIQSQQNGTQWTAEISLSGHNWGNENNPNSSNGGSSGTSASTCDNWGGGQSSNLQTYVQPSVETQIHYSHTKKSWEWSMNPSYLWGQIKWYQDMHKSFKIQLLDKREWQNEFSPNKMGGLVWYMDLSKTNVGTGAGLYKGDLKRGHSSNLELPPQYSRQKYMLSRHAKWRIQKMATKIGTSTFCQIVKQPLRHIIISR